jgi:hypothetical protein
MALNDYPAQLIEWTTGFMPNLLQSIGQLELHPVLLTPA